MEGGRVVGWWGVGGIRAGCAGWSVERVEEGWVVVREMRVLLYKDSAGVGKMRSRRKREVGQWVEVGREVGYGRWCAGVEAWGESVAWGEVL